ncbi:MAG: hypothetical protein ACRDKH_02670 [Solirubrobacterales bacterium]
MSSITDPQRLVEVVAHTMFRDATERFRRRRPPEPEPRDETDDADETRLSPAAPFQASASSAPC